MKILMMVLGWLGLISGNLIWIGHGIYELIVTDKGFFTVLFSNGGYWLLHMIISVLLLAIGAMNSKRKL